MGEYSLKLGTLDALEVAFLLLDENFQPFFLSSSAARILDVRNRQQLGTHGKLFEPLVELARATKQRIEKAGFLANDSVPSSQVFLTSADSRRFPVLAYCRAIQLANGGAENIEHAFAVIFHSLTALEPFLQILEQTRRSRSLAILAASQLNDAYHLEFMAGSAAQADGKSERTTVVDLCKIMTQAVNVVDGLIVSSIKVGLDVKTSALLEGHPENILRLISHLLLDAADFVGPGGTMKARCVLDPTEQRLHRDETLEGKAAELVILAERSPALRKHAGPLEQYIHSLCVPPGYRISVRERDPETRASKELPLKGLLSKEVSHLEGTSLSNETLSENLRIAHHLAKHERVELFVRPLRADLLAIYAQFPLSNRAVG